MGDFSIQISSNLVNSLADDKSKKKTKRTRTKPVTKPIPKIVTDDFETKKGPPTTSTGWPLQPPAFLPASVPSQTAFSELEAIRMVLHESEKVVEKLQKQEENMTNQVTQRAKELREKEFKLPYQKPWPCVAENEACMACYKAHLKDPLKCADLVRSFADCARRVRQQVGPTE